MAPHIDDNTRYRAVHWHVELGLTPQQIADLLGCSARTIQYILAHFRNYQTVRDPYRRRQRGRRRLLTTSDLDYINSYIKARPKIFLDELQEALLRHRQAEVSLSTLSRTLARLSISQKKVSSAAAERNELLRATWLAEYGHLPAEYFVWLDESSVDDLTNLRRQGWAGLGHACVLHDTFIRGQRYSVLPALSTQGIIALDIFEGSVNKERFISFVRNDIAPLLNPFPAPRSVVVIDNCAIHHDEEIRAIIEGDCGAKLVYLPPYSPDFNPIEQAFHSVKSWLRRHESQAINAAVHPWLIHQARQSITSDMALGWIQNCGYTLLGDR